MSNAITDAWSNRYPTTWEVNDTRTQADLEEWRNWCRGEQARTGEVIEHITSPIDHNNPRIDRISRPSTAMLGERSILNWACEGTLRKHGGGK